ncbi:hypothetical protein [Natronococcus sp. A-GB7]|uniref:hypothetical protein n=1 Tax=Natronococcus sp. A-GB7 TaxID=3037649 RepID=UPI00241D967E|nr:hypothetical protein [Natronococcus sp. A-GB7]MDG5818191.1 hypothetical protein [Natronococcus sp. A-GB7]
MTFPEDRLARHLVDDESVRVLETGSFLGEPGLGSVTVGLTDRRVLCVSEGGAFASVEHEHVSSVRSRPRTRLEYRFRTDDALLVGAAGALLAAIWVLVAVGADAGVGPIGGALTTTLAAVAATALAATHRIRAATGLERPVRRLLVGAGCFLLLSIAALATVFSAISPSLLALATVVGLANLACTPRFVAAFDGVGLSRTRATELTIATADGGTLRLLLEADSELGREVGASIARGDSPSSNGSADDNGPTLLARDPVEDDGR